MPAVKSITLQAFRGTLAPFVISFQKGASTQSMVVFGRNGNGKSSVTDAWERIHSGRIDRLAREGAKEGSYLQPTE